MRCETDPDLCVKCNEPTLDYRNGIAFCRSCYAPKAARIGTATGLFLAYLILAAVVVAAGYGIMLLWLRWPTFTLAATCIVVGLGLLAWITSAKGQK